MKTAVAIAWGMAVALCVGLSACGKSDEEKRKEEVANLIRLGEKYVREKGARAPGRLVP